MLNDLQIDLSAVLAGEILSLPIDCAFMPENAQEFGDITLTSPVSVRGQITGQAGYVRMSVEVTADYLAHCARCLDEIRGTLSFPIEKTVAVRGTLADEEADDVVSDYVLIENGILAIWNFAPKHLNVPDGILVQNENMAASLALLCKHLNERMQGQDG